jgi:NADH dehydrogenase
LAGAIAELAFKTLKNDFRTIDVQQTQVLLLEGLDRVLPPYDTDLSAKTAASLERLGVTIRTQTRVTQVDKDGVTVQKDGITERIPAKTVLWAAGVQASPMGKVLAERAGATLDRAGRVMVDADLSVPGHSNIFVVGDLANFAHQGDAPLPGVAPVATQEGKYVAQKICAQMEGRAIAPFTYKDVGSLAVIGQNAAVVDLGFIKFSGPLAWFIWIFAHIYYLIEFDNKMVVLMQWGWNYFTRQRGARIITVIEAEGMSPAPTITEPLSVDERVSVKVS